MKYYMGRFFAVVEIEVHVDAVDKHGALNKMLDILDDGVQIKAFDRSNCMQLSNVTDPELSDMEVLVDNKIKYVETRGLKDTRQS